MHILSRRSFLRSGGATALGLAAGSMMNVPGFLREAVANNADITWNGNKLLFLFLRGGNDCLNTIIPTGDPAYGPVIRPTLAIPAPDDPLTTGGVAPVTPQAGRAIDLGNGFATMHPNMADCIPVYNAGDLAMIHRVAYPQQSRSHFDSERYWETGVPGDDLSEEGIFYRTVVATGLHKSQLLPAVSIDSTLPLMIKGDIPMANISDPTRYDLLGVYAAARQKHIDAISRIHGMRYPLKTNRDITFPAGERFVNSISQIEDIDFAQNETGDFVVPNPAPNPPAGDENIHLFPVDAASDEAGFNDFGAYNFFRSLKYTAQILSETDAVISGTEFGGFDTHNNQGGPNGGVDGNHANLVRRIAWAMYALREFFTARGQWNNTIVVTLTEFGRTTEENDSYGTDHAEAGVMFVAGGNVNGGVYQCDAASWTPGTPGGQDGSMYEVNGRYLGRTVDYRSVLGEIIRDHLGATDAHLDCIIPGYASPAEALRTGGLSIDGQAIVGELGLI